MASANLLQCFKGSKGYGPRDLFLDIGFSINEGEHIGFIGANGTGKTTLFKILVGQEELDAGEIVRSKSLRQSYLAQEEKFDPEITVHEYLDRVGEHMDWEIEREAEAFGLGQDFMSQKISTLSGGYQMRVRLTRIQLEDPNLVLLDEPTNYLDLETVLLLEKYVQGFRGTVLLISHDREFLRRTTDHTLELENQSLTKYPGNIDDYFEQKALLRVQLEKKAMSTDQKRKEIEDFVRRFGAQATKAKQAQSRLKSLKRLEKVDIKPIPSVARIRIPAPPRISKRALRIKGGAFGYEDKTILHKVNLSLERGDKVGVVGMNGVGKSTLLKALAGRLQAQSGVREQGDLVTIGYYGQHVAQELDLDSSVLESLQEAAHSSIREQDLLDLAGSMLFSKERLKQSIRSLSGGEKARVALGRILLSRASVLLLDEVTNHLDFHTVEALTQAISRYEGTVVVVSHDRGFVARVSSKILEIRDGHVSEYPGTYDEYVWSLERGAFQLGDAGDAEEMAPKKKKVKAAPKTAPTANPSGNSGTSGVKPGGKTNYKEEKKRLQKLIRAQERAAREMDDRRATIEKEITRLSEELVAASGDAAQNLSKELGELSQERESCEVQFWKALEEIEAAEAALARIQA